MDVSANALFGTSWELGIVVSMMGYMYNTVQLRARSPQTAVLVYPQ